MRSPAEIQATAAEIALEISSAPPSKREALLAKRLKALPADERANAAAWCAAQTAALAEKLHMKNPWDKWILYASACAFLLLFLTIAIFIPEPTAFQIETFRTVLALVGAAFGAAVPGVLKVDAHIGGKWAKWSIRATGAIAIFLIIYFWNPAGRAVGAGSPPASVPLQGR